MTSDRVAAFRADIAASPSALAALLAGWVPPDLGGRRRFIVTGLGSSRFAAMLVVERLQTRGVDARVAHPSVAAWIPPADDLVLVAVSASGGTREVIDAADAHRGRSLVVVVTNVPDGPLAATADVVVPLCAGTELAGIACRTFRATIAALALLTGAASVADLRPAVAELAAMLAALDARPDPLVEGLADTLDGAPLIDVLAEARDLGLAEQAALMLREAPRLPAHAWETAEWLHVGVYLALPGHRAVIFEGSPADHEVVDTIQRRGGQILRVPDRGLEPLADGVVASVIVELATATLWDRASADDK